MKLQAYCPETGEWPERVETRKNVAIIKNCAHVGSVDALLTLSATGDPLDWDQTAEHGPLPDKVETQLCFLPEIRLPGDGRPCEWAVRLDTEEKNAEGAFLVIGAASVGRLLSGEGNRYRYNGGWAKSVTGLDKNKTDGYSLLGQFLDKGPIWLRPGLYVDCSVQGSRKNHEKYLTLYRVYASGMIRALERSHGYAWAVEFWPHVERELALIATEAPVSLARLPELEPFSDEQLAQELLVRAHERGVAEELLRVLASLPAPGRAAGHEPAPAA